MDAIVSLFRDAGFWVYPVLGLGLLALLGTPILALAGRSRGLPPFVYVLGPAIVVFAGVFGWQQGVTLVVDVLATVSGRDKELVAHAGFAEASTAFLIAGFVAAFVTWWTLVAIVVRSSGLGEKSRAWMPVAVVVVLSCGAIAGAAVFTGGAAGVVAVFPLLGFVATAGALAAAGASRFPAATAEARADVGAAALGLGAGFLVGVAALAEALEARARADVLTVVTVAPGDVVDVMELQALEILTAVSDAGAVATFSAVVLGLLLLSAAGSGVRSLFASRPASAVLTVVLAASAVVAPRLVGDQVSSALDVIASRHLRPPEGFVPPVSTSPDPLATPLVIVMTEDGRILTPEEGAPSAILADARLDAKVVVDQTRELAAKLAALYADRRFAAEVAWVAAAPKAHDASAAQTDLRARIAALGGRPRPAPWQVLGVYTPGAFSPRGFPCGLHVEKGRITLHRQSGSTVIGEADDEAARLADVQRRLLDVKNAVPEAGFILVSVGPGVTVAELVRVLDAVRRHPDGLSLYPDVYLVEEAKLDPEAFSRPGDPGPSTPAVR